MVAIGLGMQADCLGMQAEQPPRLFMTVRPIRVTLALFDLDNTLLAGDSDHAFGEFVCQQGLVDSQTFRARNDQFYRDYQAGNLDMPAYVRFALTPLMALSPAERQALLAEFVTQVIEPIILPKAQALLAKHRALGHTLVIITATHRLVTAPIAERLGVSHLIATEPAMRDQKPTGEIAGTACFQAGKVIRLAEWLAQSGESLRGSFFYSDSANDLPLLKIVSHPVAVDPCPRLLAYAEANAMPILRLRHLGEAEFAGS